MTTNQPVILHLTSLLDVGGTSRIMENFATFGDTQRFVSAVAGLRGEDSVVAEMRARGIAAGIVGTGLEHLDALVPAGGAFAVVIHRAGQPEEVWDRAAPLLQARKPLAVVECNIFGTFDGGRGDSLRDGLFCYGAHTLWRHWRQSGSPPPDAYLARHRLIHNPVPATADDAGISRLRRAFRGQMGIPEDAFVIGDVCRPAPEKLDAMLAAIMPRMLRQCPGTWVITRRFPDGMARHLQAACGNHYINLPMTVDATELLSTYAAMDVFAHFSTMGESFGMAIAEAMRCGLPVVLNETPGPRNNNAQGELVRHGISGFLANDPRAALQALKTLADSPELRHSMGAIGQAHLETPPFDPVTATRQLEGWIVELARAKGLDPVPGFEPPAHAPSEEEVGASLGNYRDEFLVVPNSGNLVNAWCLAASGRRVFWRLRRKFL